jgi:outer membrane protein assembly factor BamB
MNPRYWIWPGLGLLLLAGVWTLQAQQGGPAVADGAPVPPLNPNAIAILRWYAANEVTKFTTGCALTSGLAYDGANLWVGCPVENQVVRFRASDGELLGSFPVGNSPGGLAFDGANVWVANLEGTLTKLRASDGKHLGTFTVGHYTQSVVFDGSHVWASNATDNNVVKVQVADGKIVGRFPVQSPYQFAVAGPNIWVSSSAGAVKLRTRDGKNLGTFAMCLPGSLAFDGANMWITNGQCNTVTKLRESDGKTLGTFDSGGVFPAGVVFDSQHIWVANGSSNGQGAFVVKLRLNDGRIVGHFHLLGAGNAAFDGANVWVTVGGDVSKM